MSFSNGEKVFVNASVVNYIANDPTAPKPYYQLMLSSGQLVVALCDDVFSKKEVQIHTNPTILEAGEYKEGHYK